jgi:hypothetical protein
VRGDEGAGHAHGVAEEEPFVEHLPARECRYGGVPGQPEEGDPLVRLGAGGLVVAADVVGERPLEILLRRHGDEAARAELLQDFDHARVEPREEIARRVERIPGRPHDAPFVARIVSSVTQSSASFSWTC